MQAIKAAVVVMGILILLGFGLLIYGFVVKVGKDGDGADTQPLVPAVEEEASGFGTRSADLEDGEVVLETSVDGGHLILRTRLPSGLERLRVYRLGTGRLSGILELSTAP